MLLWTIQTIEAWETLKNTRTLCCNSKLSEHEFMTAYLWMAEQMRKRLQYRCRYRTLPLWAWYQWEGKCRKKPDLRSTGFLPRGHEGVRIEFELNNDEVLLSDFSLWHYVLNYWYLPKSKTEGEAFAAELAARELSFYETKPLPDYEYHLRIKQSWERIFDIDWTQDSITSAKKSKSIQACFWELKLGDVKRVDRFIAK